MEELDRRSRQLNLIVYNLPQNKEDPLADVWERIDNEHRREIQRAVGLSAQEGIQVLQDCILTAAQSTFQKAKAAPAQPRHKPWFDSECQAALRS